MGVARRNKRKPVKARATLPDKEQRFWYNHLTVKIAKRLLLSLLIFASIAEAAAPKEEAESAFQKGLYQEALNRWEKLPPDAGNPDRFRIFHRTQEARALLFRYGEAAQALFDSPTPSDPLEQAQFHLLRAEIARAYLSQYRRTLPSDRSTGATDITKWTREEWREKIAQEYFALLPLRARLLQTPLTEQAVYIQTQDTDVSLLPTLWDFAVSRWTQWLTQDAELGSLPDPSDLLQRGFHPRIAPETPPGELALSLWEDATRDANGLRALAVEHWRLQHLVPPWGHSATDPLANEKLALALEALSREFKQGRTKALAASHAARLYADREKYADAVRLCRAVENTVPTPECAQLRSEIETPRLEVQTRPTPSTADQRVKIRARNLKEVYVRLYPTTLDELEKNAPRANAGEWAEVRQISNAAAAAFLKKTPSHRSDVSLKPTQEFDWVETDAKLPPALPTGLYAVLVSDRKSFDAGSQFLRGAVMNVTGLFLFADRMNDPSKGRHKLSLRLLEGDSGEPAKSKTISIKGKGGKLTALKTDDNGSAAALPVGNLVDPLAKDGTQHAYLPSAVWMSMGGEVASLVLQIDADRPIYRPGQDVQARITVIHREGDAYSPARDPEATFTANDANGKTFFQQKVTFNAFGSAVVRFKLPEKGLLGVFSLQATGRESGTNTQGSAYAQIRVEEYLRPDFEVLLHKPTRAWSYGTTAKVEGAARTYFGGAVVGAPVSFRVYREPFFPPCWSFYRFQGAAEGRKIVAQGLVRTDRQGAFSFPLAVTPPPGKDPAPSRYSVEVDVTGTSGRTLSEKRAYLASRQAFAWEINPSQAFFTETGKFTIRAVSLEDVALDTRARASIYALEGGIPDAGLDATAGETPKRLGDLKTGSRVHTGSLRTGPTAAELKLPKLPPGFYRLRIEGADRDGTAISGQHDFVVWGDRLALPAIALPQRKEYSVGQTAKTLIGSSDLRGKMVVEVWRGEQRLQAEIVPAGLRIHHLPITLSHRGGVTLRWYGVFQNRLRRGDARIGVPWEDRKLNLKLTTGPAPKPGDKVTWQLDLRDAQGKNVEGEALIRVVDRSLEAYAKLPDPWVETLYGPAFETPPTQTSASETSFAWLRDQANGPKSPAIPQTPPVPHLRSTQSRFGYTVMSGGAPVRSLAPMGAAADSAMMAKTAEGAPDAHSREESNTVRTQFQETAFFGPQILLKDGKATVHFQFSDSATDWSVTGFALDKQTRWSAISTRIATARDFMVEAQPPRFAREKDRVAMPALVHNHSAHPLSGSVALQIVFENAVTRKSETRALKAQGFRLAPGTSRALNWDVDIPEGSGEISVQVRGQAGKLFDASLRRLLWLPSRYRFATSVVTALETQDTKTLALSAPATAKAESSILQIDPQLAGAIVSALPQLVEPERGDVVSVVNRLVPLALTRKLLADNPELRAVFAKAPKLKTQTVPWDAKDPRRTVLLEETPWLVASEGGPKASVDLRDNEAVESLAKKTWRKLEGFQTREGAFTWFPGGQADAYLTIYVLGMLAEAKRHGVVLPDPLVSKAEPYLKRELPQWLKPEAGSLSNAVFAGSVVAGLYSPKDWDEWLRRLAAFVDQHADALTPMGKAYVADMALRTGDKARGDTYLSRALDGARENETGTYWAPEKQSWSWYEDSLEQHSLFLKLLAEWKPDDKRLTGMVRWLLFQRKASQWRSPRSAASAILALLQYQRHRGALFTPENFKWDWDGKKQTVALTGKEFLDMPLRWIQTHPTARALQAKVEKSGQNIAFASLTTVWIGNDAPESSSGPLALGVRYFLRHQEASGQFRLDPLSAGQKLPLGSQIEVQCTLTASSALEYLHLRLPRAAGLEPVDLVSEWQFENPAYYREVRDATDGFFLPRLPAGEVTVRTRYFATTGGDFRFGPATAQSLYSPDLTATAPGMPLRITPAP